jgi:hypothetical protein
MGIYAQAGQLLLKLLGHTDLQYSLQLKKKHKNNKDLITTQNLTVGILQEYVTK